MPSPFDGLADAFVGALGVPVTVTPAGGASRTIFAIPAMRPSLEVEITQPEPIIHARDADVSDLAEGDEIEVPEASARLPGGTYRARVFKEDGKGMTEIMLERV